MRSRTRDLDKTITMVRGSYLLVSLVVAVAILPASRTVASDPRGEIEISSQQFEKPSARESDLTSLPVESDIIEIWDGRMSPERLIDEIGKVLREGQEDHRLARLDSSPIKIQKRSRSNQVKISRDPTEANLVDYILQSYGRQARAMHRPHTTNYRRQSKYFGFNNPYLKFVSEGPEFRDLPMGEASKAEQIPNSEEESTQLITNQNYR